MKSIALDPGQFIASAIQVCAYIVGEGCKQETR